MKKQSVTIKIVFLLILLVIGIITCTTNSPTEPGFSGKGVTISISQEGKDSADYIGRDLNLLVKFDDSVVANFSNVIALQSLGAKFVATEEMVKLTKVKELIIPLYWTNYAQLKKDTINDKSFLYMDSIYISVFDDLNNETGRSNVVRAYIKNIPPQINSFTAGDSVYVVPSHITDVLNYNYYLSANSDSIRIYVTAYDPDPQNLFATWKIITNNTTQSEADQLLSWSSTTLYATYFVRNSSSIRDYITCFISDGDKQVPITLRMIRSDGFDTKADSIQFADTTFKGSATTFVYKSVTIDSISVMAFPHEDGGTPNWSVVNGSIKLDTIKDSDGYAITYINNSSIKNDTIHTDTLILLDTLKLNIVNSFGDDSTVYKLIIYKKPLNTAPIVDSIQTDTLSQKPVSGRVNFVMEAGTTINLSTFAHDFEGGSVSYSWSDSKLKGVLSGLSGATITYTANDSMYYDTVLAIVTDSASFSDTVDVILFVDSRPVFNSVKVDGSTFSGSADVLAKVTALDSFSIVVDVTDPDVGDSLTYLWDNSSAKIDSIYYITADSTYDDTVTVTATDKYGLEASKEIVISVSKP